MRFGTARLDASLPSDQDGVASAAGDGTQAILKDLQSYIALNQFQL